LENLAPVIIFAYNRPRHLRQLLQSLSENDLACHSDVFIYIDKPVKEIDITNNQAVVNIANEDWNFNNKKIIIRETNFGLRKNILSGISEVVSKYEKIIVLEDDLVLSKYFLKYMNEALFLYKEQNNVWHIAGFNYKTPSLASRSSFFSSHMNCWGWATWENRWHNISTDLQINISKEDIDEFNFGNLIPNNYQQLLLNQQEKISTWAIYWYQTIFLNNGLCLVPNKTLVFNDGFDGSGVNTSRVKYKLSKLNHNPIIKFPKDYRESVINRQFLKWYFLKLKIKDYVKYHINKLSF
jgi:hypothetical protein|tara:strand:+ start:2739 stop:3626 length:888 start_codon:yes stop_codon:yes gene_type:complete